MTSHSSDLSTVTIEGLRPKNYFIVIELALKILNYDLQDAIKLSDPSSVDHTLRIQQLRIQKEAILKALKDNVLRFASSNEVKDEKEILDYLNSLIEIHDRFLSCDTIDIKFDSFLEDLQQADPLKSANTTQVSLSNSNSPLPSSPSFSKKATIKNHKSMNWDKKHLSVRDALLIALKEFEHLEKKIFAVIDMDHAGATTHGRLSHVIHSIPR
jgi:hypothetical protein